MLSRHGCPSRKRNDRDPIMLTVVDQEQDICPPVQRWQYSPKGCYIVVPSQSSVENGKRIIPKPGARTIPYKQSSMVSNKDTQHRDRRACRRWPIFMLHLCVNCHTVDVVQ